MFLNFLRGEPEVFNGSNGGSAFICRSQDHHLSSYSFSCGWPLLAWPHTVHLTDCLTIICSLDVYEQPQLRPLAFPLQSSRSACLLQLQHQLLQLTIQPYASAFSFDQRGASFRRYRPGQLLQLAQFLPVLVLSYWPPLSCLPRSSAFRILRLRASSSPSCSTI